ncbi:DMT family transporter [Roseixanthobacter glucoisosaccharinicivorans]|uniref:DMT family transporter n=1 Tax=Roseixanthobacter glucoisosaccharinicivorans TaxID=3119923 RepID=UPI0037296FB1
MTTLYLAAAFIIGACISLQAPINNQLAQAFGHNTILAALFSFLVGTAFLTVVAVAQGGIPAALAALPSQPLWKLCGGFLGAAFIIGSIYLVPKIGLASLLALVICGQLISSLLLDHYGLVGLIERRLTPVKLVGALIIMAGVIFMLFGDRLLSAIRNS